MMDYIREPKPDFVMNRYHIDMVIWRLSTLLWRHDKITLIAFDYVMQFDTDERFANNNSKR